MWSHAKLEQVIMLQYRKGGRELFVTEILVLQGAIGKYNI